MGDTDNFHFDERDKRLIKAVLEGTENLIKSAIKPIKTNLKNLVDVLNSKGIFEEPFTFSESPKRITERGQKLLNENNIEHYLFSHPLLKPKEIEKFKKKEDAEIFIDCFKWVENNEEKRVLEIIYNSNINKEQCIELLALAIVEKIKSRIHSDRK